MNTSVKILLLVLFWVCSMIHGAPVSDGVAVTVVGAETASQSQSQSSAGAIGTGTTVVRAEESAPPAVVSTAVLVDDLDPASFWLWGGGRRHYGGSWGGNWGGLRNWNWGWGNRRNWGYNYNWGYPTTYGYSYGFPMWG